MNEQQIHTKHFQIKNNKVHWPETIVELFQSVISICIWHDFFKFHENAFISKLIFHFVRILVFECNSMSFNKHLR